MALIQIDESEVFFKEKLDPFGQKPCKEKYDQLQLDYLALSWVASCEILEQSPGALINFTHYDRWQEIYGVEWVNAVHRATISFPAFRRTITYR